ncbi:hypothetical protein TrVE_jg303 [Triparma verrucosa]|uniref:RING-type E3 ubiquitin transferase n=2 Tax=Triparma TaxID=722752 RepID=A0A9W6ZP16_9STRA|nr:hypothetical protein TrST_g5697 [Triparma strigata]GMH85353.1 hypothetical protein TrVE_jg303 [Triparma verrucosa]
MLSRPADLTALVSLSQTDPTSFVNFESKNILQRMVDKLLNNTNESVSDKDTKLDILSILSNVAADSSPGTRDCVRTVLLSVSEWFDDYLCQEESGPSEVEPELHKSMLLLLCRCWDYRLKTEDVLELTRDDRTLALETVVGVLEDGETYATELVQRAKPGGGRVGQWEHELVTRRHEKPLVLQTCRLLKGFTSAPTYFTNTDPGEEITLHDVGTFQTEISNLLAITLKSRLVEKLALALHDVLFANDFDSDSDDDEDLDSDDEDWDKEKEERRQQKALQQLERGLLDGSDHQSITAVFHFLQNLYTYAGPEKADVYRQHLLADTLLVPRLLLPYLNRCVAAANLLSRRAETYSSVLGNEEKGDVEKGVLDDMSLVQGCAAALRVLIIASFRAPPTRFVLGLLRRLNPTASLLRAAPFVARHDYLFSLLCLLNVNMGALDLSTKGVATPKFNDESDDDADEEGGEAEDGNLVEAYYAHSLLHDMAGVYNMMSPEVQQKVLHRVCVSGALPVSRDTSSYSAVKSMLEGGASASQKEYLMGADGAAGGSNLMGATMDEDMFRNKLRAEAKERSNEVMSKIGEGADGGADGAVAESKDGEDLGEEEAKNEVTDEEERRRKKEKRKAKKKAKRKEQRRKEKEMGLLGDLPSLDGRSGSNAGAQEFINLDLELPEKMKKRKQDEENTIPKKGGLESNKMTPSKYFNQATGVPPEFGCSINGHLMKEPVRTPGGVVFERETIELWLKTRGSVCPISGVPLTVDELEADENLMAEITRWQIRKTSMSMPGDGVIGGAGVVVGLGGGEVEDDVYDF